MNGSCLFLALLLTTLQVPATRVLSQSGSGTGEHMQYKLRYSIFQVGEAIVSCMENQGGDIYHISVDARSNGLLKIFNKMNYHLESRVDPGTGLPDFAVIDLKDRKNRLYNELVFDQKAAADSAKVLSQLSGEHRVSGHIYEILTGFYHFRKNLIGEDQQPGNEVIIQTFYPDKPWELVFICKGEETLKTEIGDVLCYTYTPGTIAGRFFEREDAMTVWFTKAEPHIPVRFRLDLKIGALHGVIEDYAVSRE